LRYTEPRDQSAALLRMVIKEMGQHDAAFNPLPYTVWYEYLAGINPALSKALDELRQQMPRLDDEAMVQLHRDYVADADSPTATRVASELQRVMTGIAESAASAGSAAGSFGAQLNDLSAALKDEDLDALTPRLHDALAGTEKMKSSVDSLQEQLSVSLREIETLRADLQRAREDALTDPLSGVYNRKGFDQRLAEMIAAAPPEGTAHCLVMLDLDHFKRVNDTHGHLVGDSVIQALGQVLRKVAADAGLFCARYGGEEFAVLLPASTIKQAVQVAEQVRARTKALKVRDRATNATLVTPTISAGVAAWVPGKDASTLIASADAALYRSKQNGRDRVTVA
jgi:diguanylate cyclase